MVAVGFQFGIGGGRRTLTANLALAITFALVMLSLSIKRSKLSMNVLQVRLLENTVLFDEIVDDRLLVAVKPAGQGNYEEMERLYDVCHCRTDYPQY
jgi:hypothetical protein